MAELDRASSVESRLWWREPLLYFVFGGALIWAFGPRSGDDSDRAVDLSPALIEGLEREEVARTGRMPRTAVERGAMISRFLRDEVLFREALRLGLDAGDVIVRRRMIQKMEFLLREGDLSEPSDADLSAFLRAHAVRFHQPPRYSFEHRFWRSSGAAHEGLQRLRAGAAAPGEPFVLGRSIGPQAEPRLVDQWGEAFVGALREAPPGAWVGPVQSSYGHHAIYLFTREPERLPALEEIRPGVLAEWRERARESAFEESMQRLIEQYEIRR